MTTKKNQFKDDIDREIVELGKEYIELTEDLEIVPTGSEQNSIWSRKVEIMKRLLALKRIK